MALTFLNMREHVFAGGFQHLNDAGTELVRVKRIINDSRNEINDEFDGQWPFLETSASGSSPLTLTRMRTIESVYDSTNARPLSPADRRDLIESYSTNLTTTGAPQWFYTTGGTAVAVFPVQVVTLAVRFWQFEADMSADGDEPLMPDRYRMSVVHLARAKLHREAGNEGQAQSEQNDAQRLVSKMASAFSMGQQAWGTVQFVPAQGVDC